MDFTNPFTAAYGDPSILQENIDDQYPPQPSGLLQQQALMDDYLPQPLHYPGYQPGIHVVPDEYEDCEIMTRPRLTKEQVEVLEHQFQEHPKPNSATKRTLAQQTNLPLPRVSNWFQNRRAKAKLLKKQECEMQQAMGNSGQWDKDEPEQSSSPDHRPRLSTSSVSSIKTPSATPTTKKDDASTEESRPLMTSPSFDSIQEAGYASLQRAINAAIAGREQFDQQLDDPLATAVPATSASDGSPIRSSGALNSSASQSLPISAFSDWGSSAASSVVWTPSQSSDDPYDFNGIIIPQQQSHNQSPLDSNSDSVRQSLLSNQTFGNFSFAPSSNVFSEPLDEEVPPCSANHETQIAFNPDTMSMAHPLRSPFFSDSRRGSSSEELADSLGHFALQSIGQATPVPSQSDDTVFKRPDAHIDIAARRNRPRPAALGSAALRSRSFAGPPTMSPTPRITPTAPSAAIRKIKSTGQGLNINYSGVRKVSSAQRSPLNHATFADAGSFENMVCCQNSQVRPSKPASSTLAPPTPLSPHDGSNVLTENYGNEMNLSVDQDTPSHFAPTLGMSATIASPPQTPQNAELLMQMQNLWMAPPPLSAPAQYATFPEYTPPYSAGPLTSGSWSDASLTSPELHSFPPTIHMPQPPYVSQMFYGEPDLYQPSLHTSSSQGSLSYAGMSPVGPQKPTEFYIQEFPKQKEEHAHAAKQLAGSKPRNYIFANATSSNYQQNPA